jgi:pyridoxal phosphate enzyme (YggS family)
MTKQEIAKNLACIKKELKTAQLIAVTKYSPIEDVVTAYQAHHYDFGENRVSDLQLKAEFFKKEELKKVRWHFIGHLQTNKVRELYKIPNLYAIHSVDSQKLLEELIKREQDFEGPELKLFFQVNTSHEVEKSGFETAEELKMAIDLLLKRGSSKLKFYGLMTMGTIRTTEFEAEALRCFRDLSAVAHNLETSYKLPQKLKLSMGMSQDYRLAIAAGSDFIRVGSAIFKQHLPHKI